MEKKIQDYLPFYLGCECVCTNEKDIQILTCVEPVMQKAWMITGISYHTDVVKPILRPLSDMTEQELIKVLQITIPDDFPDAPTDEDYDLEIFHNDGGNLVDADVAIGAEFSCRCYVGQIVFREDGSIYQTNENGEAEKLYNLPKAYNYLLSKHFDLFNLIEAGLAIDKSTLQKTK